MKQDKKLRRRKRKKEHAKRTQTKAALVAKFKAERETQRLIEIRASIEAQPPGLFSGRGNFGDYTVQKNSARVLPMTTGFNRTAWAVKEPPHA